MFTNVKSLEPAKHGNLRLRDTTDYLFAAQTMMAPVVFSEIADVALEYPITFPSRDDLPLQVLLGFEKGRNAYVSKDGRWLAKYIPLHFQRYPFALAKRDAFSPDGKQAYSVVFDTDAPQISETVGSPLFAPDGEHSPILSDRMQLLEKFQKSEIATQRALSVISGCGLLKPFDLRVRTATGVVSLTGMRRIDEAMLNSLPDHNLGELHRSNALALIYAHLISLPNLKRGPLAGEASGVATEGLAGTLIIGDDDMIRFT
ncbi:SapC family protein [Desulfonatronum lacustre]|uniref:SapC family protein n=1 Tax=Desulfonatronum lacustre TaxID=66849 RepID=UPI00048C843F|nr:SapC family protein [Desulfonatronum lacustre]